MTSKHWFWFVVIQVLIVNALSLPWFFNPMPQETWMVVIRAVYLAAGWFVILGGVVLMLKRWREERWRTPRHLSVPSDDEWRILPSYPDYQINRAGEVWDTEQGYMLTPRRGGGYDWYDLYTEEGRRHHLRDKDGLIMEAFLHA